MSPALSGARAIAPRSPRPGAWRIVDSTLREGEQFAKAAFTTHQKLEIARALDAFGVDYIEVTTPVASPRSCADAALIARLGLRAKVMTHCRCVVDDVKAAIDCGVGGVGLLFATSPTLTQFSHGKSIAQIVDAMGPPIEHALRAGLETRFSPEDTFRSAPPDLMTVYRAAEELGVHRVGLADTVGVATPRQVAVAVRRLRRMVRCDINFHAHDDLGCAVANAYEAVAAGATHVDVSVLGIGERVGIVSLAGFVARMRSLDPEGVGRRYDVRQLLPLEQLVARIVSVEVPFNSLARALARE